ncbi:AI-2E family transporter [Lachnospiraceae bacterium ZAX-1]
MEDKLGNTLEDKKGIEFTEKDIKEEAVEKTNWNIKPYLAIGLTVFIIVIMSIAVFFAIFRYQELSASLDRMLNILQPIIIGLVFAYLIAPIVNAEERWLVPRLENYRTEKRKAKTLARFISICGALVLVFVIIAILLEMVIPELYRSIVQLVYTLPRQVDAFMVWFNNYTNSDTELAGYVEMGLTRATEYLENWAKTEFFPQTKNIVTSLTTGLIGVIKLLVNFVIGVILSVYLLMSKETFIGQSKKIIYAIFPSKSGNVIIETVRKSNEIFGGFISGKIVDSFIIGVICFVALYLLKMPYAVLVSVIVGVTNIVPFFGPYVGAVPSAILITLSNPIQGLYFVIFILILQQVDGNIIGPRILGESTGLSAFWVVFAILVGSGLFGFAGIIMGVPVFGVIYYLVKKIIEAILKRKRLPMETEEYTKLSSVNEEDNSPQYEQLLTSQEKKQKKRHNKK